MPAVDRLLSRAHRAARGTSCLLVAGVLAVALAQPGSSRAQDIHADGSMPDRPAPSFADRAFSSAQELVLQAIGLIGIRYQFGGRSPETGFDCSGLVRYVFDRVTGRSLPATSFEMARLGTQVDRSELHPGDLVFYNTRGQRYSHVGIYVGDGRFIHSPSPGGRVHIVDMRNRYWMSRFNGARRLAS